MKNLFIGLMLLSSMSVFSAEKSCRSHIPGEDGMKEVGVSFDSDKISVNGLPDKKVIESIEIEMNGAVLAKCLADDIDMLECVENQTPDAPSKNDSKKSLYSGLAYYDDIKTDEIMAGVSELDIDISKVVRGVIYSAGYGGFYPNPGVYEYFDKNDNLLGTFLYNIVPVPCN
jgi:hypothetical protein